MSERQIAVGDLVMVVHRCCDQIWRYGRVFEVLDIEGGGGICPSCQFRVEGRLAVTGHITRSVPLKWYERLLGKPQPPEIHIHSGIPISWLKRIPPLETPEREESEVAA